MVPKRKYNTWLAAFLLGFYAFIATPIQVWHQHKYSANTSAPDSKKEGPVYKSDSKNVDANCQICSHHYSVYADDASTVFVIAISNEVVKEGFSLQFIHTVPFFTLPGRGPPAV